MPIWGFDVIGYFLRRKFLVHLLTAFIIIGGLFALWNMKYTVLPPLEFRIIAIQVSMPGASPSEMESLVTFPLERSLTGLPGVKKSNSTSRDGWTTIYLHYDYSYSGFEHALREVEDRVNNARRLLPDHIEVIQVRQQRVSEQYFGHFAFTGYDIKDPVHMSELRKLRERLTMVPGVVRVSDSTPSLMVYVEPDLKKLKERGLTIEMLKEQIRTGFQYAPVGLHKGPGDEALIEVSAISPDLDSLAALPLQSNQLGESFRLDEVAQVKKDRGISHYRSTFNGEPSYSLTVFHGAESDLYEVRAEVEKAIADFNKNPENIRLTEIGTVHYFLDQQIQSVQISAILGFILVILLLYLFMNTRTAGAVAFGLPIAYAGAILVLFALGVSVNLLTITGVILVIGMLVDDAVIIGDKYLELRSEGLEPMEAAQQAARRLVVPVLGTVLTTIVAFSPIFILKNELSSILAGIPLVVIAALTVSILEAFLILPHHLKSWCRKTSERPWRLRLMNRITAFYERLLRPVLRFRYAVILLAFVIPITGLFLIRDKIKTEFNMNLAIEDLAFTGRVEEASSVDEVISQLSSLEEAIVREFESITSHRSVEAGEIWFHGRTQKGVRNFIVRLYFNDEVKASAAMREDALRRAEEFVANYPKDGLEELSASLQKGGHEAKGQNLVKVNLESRNTYREAQLEQLVINKVRALPFIRQYIEDESRNRTVWRFQPDPEQIHRHGLSPWKLNSQIRGFFTDDEFWEGPFMGENMSFVMRLKPPSENVLADLNNLTILNKFNNPVPLRSLGSWVKAKAQGEIRHANGLKISALEFEFDERQLNRAAVEKRIAEVLAPEKRAYPEYYINVVPSDDSESKNAEWALKIAIACILGVLFVLALTLQSLSQPLIVSLPIPFTLFGVLFALYFHNLPWGLMATVGLLGAIGVSVNASIVMMDEINQLKRSGTMSTREAVRIGASKRLRPILLTTLTTLGGVFPMAYAIGGDSGFTRPIAFSLAWGLLSATLVTLFLIPGCLTILEDLKDLAKKVLRLRTARPPSPAAVGSAKWPESELGHLSFENGVDSNTSEADASHVVERCLSKEL